MSAAAALINLWLGFRVGQVRHTSKVSIGAGDSMPLLTRMRAQANFIEYSPFVLILVGLIELGGGTRGWLWIVALVYLVGRILHAFGMEGNIRLRVIGFAITFCVLAGLAGYALYLPYTIGA